MSPFPPSGQMAGKRLAVAWIGIGSNLGHPLQRCLRVIAALARHPRIHLVQVSSCYRTQPVGFGRQPWFINAVAEIATSLPPLALLRTLQRLETRFGRDRRHEFKNGPRSMDLDLLFHDQRVLRHPLLRLPHPGISHRRFVLVPLAEISPRLLHPVMGKTIDLLLKETDDVSQVVRVVLENNKNQTTHLPS
ncbi:MAG: 2-amino-4-hydroxy-6-hydroxymethyldihydropteridine diphosphokinase [Magnetococcales bacterium]|nr:2-amino-4-hydroxy-6-hydroxymethyldihydropteridine diphosphokinase [Magnetococcales bacterium]MBF0630252.1 2-amino-4-hydroxy-6-hydroxymethyldihydropteridine diphosphokinase [Magnetococcales bacterium]